MAAGLTVSDAKLGELRAFLEEELGAMVNLGTQKELQIDGAVSAAGASIDMIELVEQAGPFGAGNPSPLFALPSHRILHASAVGGDHIRCTIAGPDKTRLKAIAFRAMGSALGELLLSERQTPVHLAGRLTVDEWGARRVPSFQIEDAAAVQ